MRLGSVAVDGDRQFVLAVDPAQAKGVVDLDVIAGSLDDLDGDTVAVARVQVALLRTV